MPDKLIRLFCVYEREDGSTYKKRIPLEINPSGPLASKEFLSKDQVVEYLHGKGLSHFNVRSVLRATYETSNQRLKTTKIAGRAYYKVSDVDNWIEIMGL